MITTLVLTMHQVWVQASKAGSARCKARHGHTCNVAQAKTKGKGWSVNAASEEGRGCRHGWRPWIRLPIGLSNSLAVFTKVCSGATQLHHMKADTEHMQLYASAGREEKEVGEEAHRRCFHSGQRNQSLLVHSRPWHSVFHLWPLKTNVNTILNLLDHESSLQH